MAETRSKIIGALGTILVAAVVAAYTHYLDKSNWKQQHEIERHEYRQLQAEKVFDTVTTRISRFIAAAEALNIYLQGAPEKEREMMLDTVDRRFRESEMSFPLDRVKVKLYFSDSTSRAFERSFPLQGWVVRESRLNQMRKREGIDSLVALSHLLTNIATMMASELGRGTTK